jgi:glycosyltransferase involved in cell wall biosynthesis
VSDVTAIPHEIPHDRELVSAANVDGVGGGLLIAIPAFNEARSLPGTLAELSACMPGCHVVVVSDGSRDATASVARSTGAAVLELPFNLGIGGALRTAFQYAVLRGYDCAVQFDADGQHDPRDIAKLVEGLDRGLDLVIGSRFATDGEVTYPISATRLRSMRILRSLVKALVGETFTDTTSGFRAFSRQMLEYFAETYPVEYLDSVEALVLACNAGFATGEVPVRIRSRSYGAPSTQSVRLAYYYLRLLVVMATSVRRRRRWRGQVST